MTEATDSNENPFLIKRYLIELEPFMGVARQGDLQKDEAFLSCVRASLAKAYDFAVFVENDVKEETAFYSIGSLRSICEDLIILKIIGTFSRADQQLAIMEILSGHFEDSLIKQEAFFSLFRPAQPIIAPPASAKGKPKDQSKMLALWRRNGWPNKVDGKLPPTEQMARKIGRGTVDILYEYIFRLTSETVHFNPRALLRTGWGDIDANNNGVMTYATKNYGRYYLAFCRVYGAFLLTIYAEFFGELVSMPDPALSSIKHLRRALAVQPRWPEMVTHEEMNHLPPTGGEIFRFVRHFMIADEVENGFIAAAEKAKAALKP